MTVFYLLKKTKKKDFYMIEEKTIRSIANLDGIEFFARSNATFGPRELEFLERCHKDYSRLREKFLPDEEQDFISLERDLASKFYTLNNSSFVELYTKCKIIFAKKNDYLLGYLACRELPTIIASKLMLVHEIYVLESMRKSGIGNALFNHFIASEHPSKVALKCQEKNPSKKFFEKLGFKGDVNVMGEIYYSKDF